jgi:hypothetical protein
MAPDWSVEMVDGAFEGANKGDGEEVLDSLAALGILAGYEAAAPGGGSSPGRRRRSILGTLVLQK